MDNQPQPSTSGIIERNKRTSKRKLFKHYWLSDDIFKDWLMPPDNNGKALCMACNKLLTCGKSELVKHSKTQIHIENMNKGRNITTSALLPNHEIKKEDHIKQVKTAEIKLAAFFAEHNIAFQTADHMVPLLKEICSDPQVVNDLALSKKKCSQIIKNVLGKRETDKLLMNLKDKKFSILVGESTTVSKDKLLCVLVKYVSVETKKCVTELLQLVSLSATDCSTEKLYSSFQKCFQDKDIPISNIVGLACYNASPMIGIRDCFVSRLKKEVPTLVVLRCICHSLAIIVSKACAKLPESCDYVLHAVATYFSCSAKRSTILCEFQDFFEVESHKILKLPETSWLILQKCVVRLLDNWEDLKCYFNLETVENENNKSALTIFNILNDNKIKAYMSFLKYSLQSFHTFNALFQGQQVLIHKLVESSEYLIKQIASNFLLPDALINISLDTINQQNCLPLKSVYVGPDCESLLELESLEFVSEIKSKCLCFYTTALQEMIQLLPYNNEMLRELKFLDPGIALHMESRLAFPDLRNVARHFQISDITALAHEWRFLPIIFNDEEKTFLASLEIDDMWKNIFQKKNFNDEPQFPNLEKLVNIILTLPHSNAEAERIFSIVTDVKSKKRNRMDASTLDAICKVRSYFQNNNIDYRSFQVDSTYLEMHNTKNLFPSTSSNKMDNS